MCVCVCTHFVCMWHVCVCGWFCFVYVSTCFVVCISRCSRCRLALGLSEEGFFLFNLYVFLLVVFGLIPWWWDKLAWCYQALGFSPLKLIDKIWWSLPNLLDSYQEMALMPFFCTHSVDVYVPLFGLQVLQVLVRVVLPTMLESVWLCGLGISLSYKVGSLEILFKTF